MRYTLNIIPKYAVMIILLISLVRCNNKSETKYSEVSQTDSLYSAQKQRMTELSIEEGASLALNSRNISKPTIYFQNLLKSNDKFIITNFEVIDVAYSKDGFELTIKSMLDKWPTLQLTCTEELMLLLYPNLESISMNKFYRSKILIITIVDFNLYWGGKGQILKVLKK